MKQTLLFFSTLLLLSTGYTQSIEEIAEAESKLKIGLNIDIKEQLTKTVNADYYDVTQYDLSFDLTDTDYSFGGISTIYANILAEIDMIQLDAQNNLNIASVTVDGENMPFNHTDDILTVNLNRYYTEGETIEIEVQYNSTYGDSIGMNLDYQGYYGNTPLITTLSEPYGASSWWVGADNLIDKADVVNIIVQHDGDYKVGSNGTLISRTPQSDGSYITHWRTSYPIPAYLISIGMSDYDEYSNSAMVGGIDVPIINYIYPYNNTQEVRDQLDDVPSFVEFFSELIGDYPYKNEKYGHIQWNWGGGMEHATMSSQVHFGTSLTAHELAHQWFGDKITCGTWSDIWLNEGFATYFEGLLRRNLFGEEFFRDWKEYKIYNITSSSNGSVYVPSDQLTDDRIFSARLSYNKGAMVLNMLRFKLGDENFYQAIRNYLEDPALAYGFAITDDLQAHLENQSGEDLTEFFADWVYGEGFPYIETDLGLNAGNKSGVLKITQTPSHSSVDFFETPFEIEFFGYNGESEIRRYELTENNQEFYISDLPFKIKSYNFNANYDILAWVTAEYMGTENVSEESDNFKIYPNPIVNNFFVLSTNVIQYLEIYAMDGKLLKTVEINSNESEVSIAELPKGIYMLKAHTNEGIRTEKIIKK
ncbi:T9SS type A sorting domain-containing protein [Flavobacteriaceae bacterium Ap0902]|nr:T9SS type A sorting domain-containing protein [Flavobacteriaceae bacterium Ap0902]